MRAVVQKCNWCKVDSEGEETASISKGFVVLLGVKKAIPRKRQSTSQTRSFTFESSRMKMIN